MNKVVGLDSQEVVETTNLGLVRNVLSMLHNVKSEQELNEGLFKGLSTNYYNN